MAQLRQENVQLQVALRDYLRCVAPTWSGVEPVPRGPPEGRVYEPPQQPRGTAPWRGVRGLRPVGL